MLLLCGLLPPKAAFLSPFPFIFPSRGSGGVTHFLQKSPTWCTFLWFLRLPAPGSPRGRSCAGALGCEATSSRGGLGLWEGWDRCWEPSRAFLAGIPAGLWLCSDTQGGREGSGGLWLSLHLPQALLVLPAQILYLSVSNNPWCNKLLTVLRRWGYILFFHDFS